MAASPTPSGPPTITKWLNQACSPEGSEARTISGGKIVCKKVGSDPAPEWHAVDPSSSARPSGDVPTIRRWLNQPCSPEGAKGKTISGGNIICERVGSDQVPEWHAVDPTAPAP